MRSKACTQMTAFHLIDGAGVWVQQEQPQEVSRLLLQFIRGYSLGLLRVQSRKSPLHSTTSSASDSKVAGSAMPSSWAVLRLITNSYLIAREKACKRLRGSLFFGCGGI